MQQLDCASQEVFHRLAGSTCVPVPEMCVQEPAGASRLISLGLPIVAEVAFSGSLLGVCVLSLAPHSARDLTRTLLNAPLSTPFEDSLLFDTVGEVCNMIAGSWKGRLAAPFSGSALSPPIAPKASTRPRYTRLNLSRVYSFASHLLLVELSLA